MKEKKEKKKEEEEERRRRRKKDEDDEEDLNEGKTFAGKDNLYTNYLRKRMENRESYKKVDDEDEKAEYLRTCIEQEEALFSKVVEEHLFNMNTLQDLLEAVE